MTTLVDSVAARIADQVPQLAGAIEGAIELAALIEEGALPQKDVAAFVVPLGFDDRGGDSSTGAHTQILAHQVGVIVVIKSRGDVKARAALPKVDDLEVKLLDAVAGWAPADVAGVFRAIRGRLVPGGKGVVIYQLDFGLLDQLRIMS